MKAGRMAQVGTILIVVSVGLAFLWWYTVGYVFLDWHRSHQISSLIYAVLMVSLPTVFVVVGLIMYVAGRRTFWNSATRRKGLLALLGLALMTVGGFLGAWYWASAVYAASKLGPPYNRPVEYYVATNSPYFVLFALWILSGLFLFADAIEAVLTKK